MQRMIQVDLDAEDQPAAEYLVRETEGKFTNPIQIEKYGNIPFLCRHGEEIPEEYYGVRLYYRDLAMNEDEDEVEDEDKKDEVSLTFIIRCFDLYLMYFERRKEKWAFQWKKEDPNRRDIDGAQYLGLMGSYGGQMDKTKPKLCLLQAKLQLSYLFHSQDLGKTNHKRLGEAMGFMLGFICEMVRFKPIRKIAYHNWESEEEDVETFAHILLPQRRPPLAISDLLTKWGQISERALYAMEDDRIAYLAVGKRVRNQ